MKRLKDEDFGNTTLGRLRKFCWNLTEYPETSLAARVRFIKLTLAANNFNMTCFSCMHLLVWVWW